MKRLLVLLVPLAVAPAWAGGFFDDFDGEDLGSHWSFGNPKGGMTYSVHDSLLEVHSLEGFSSNEWIRARIPEFNDFDMRAVVGWTDAPREQLLMVLLDAGPFPNPPGVAWMAYARGVSGGEEYNVVQARFAGGPGRNANSPPGGFHEFRITRTRGVFTAYLNGDLFLEGTGSDIQPRWLTLYFDGPDGENVDLFVDRVLVVPEPASVLALAAGIGSLILRRRRRTR